MTSRYPLALKILHKNLLEAAIKAPGYVSDSRRFQEGDIFVALKGAKSDGHDFVPEILKRKPGLVIVRESYKIPPEVSAESARLLARVHDTHFAHRALAAYFRSRFRGLVVAVGGSSGKTTTKEFLNTLLLEKYRVVKTQKSQNGELGIPLTLELLRNGVDVAVVEIGIDAPNDMAQHAALVQPDVSLLTSIGEEHLNLLKTVDRVFEEETVLFDVTLARKGACFASQADPWLSRLKGEEGIQLVPADFEPRYTGETGQLSSRVSRQNARLAMAVAQHLGLSDPEIRAGLRKLQLPEGRGVEFTTPEGTVVLADHYNSNPSSLKAALEHVAGEARKRGLGAKLVLGDMLDLGDRSDFEHDSLLDAVRAVVAKEIFLVGPKMSRLEAKLKTPSVVVKTFADSEAAAQAIKALRTPRSLVLVKGSRGMALEKVITAFGG